MERRKLTKEDIDKVRNIEGFPIGTDEDIIALSDAPYYTACPNPFIEEFIRENGTPYDEATDDYHREPFAADVSEGKNDPVYTAHSYHTKVPHRAIMRYIEHYTKPGDIVFDGFCGTGMTGVAAEAMSEATNLFNNISDQYRYAILCDLSPAATYIASRYNVPQKKEEFNRISRQIVEVLRDKCGWMFKTRHMSNNSMSFLGEDGHGDIDYTVWSDVFICPKCSSEIVYWDVAVDFDKHIVADQFNCPFCAAFLKKRDCKRAQQLFFDDKLNKQVSIAKQVPVRINYYYGGKRYSKKPDNDDLEILTKIDKIDIPYWYPIDALPKGYNTEQPIRSHGVTNIHYFFTKRVLYELAIVYDEIQKISDETIKNTLLTLLTGILNRNAYKCNRFIVNKYNPNGRINGPKSGTLYIPSLVVEQNIADLLKYKIPQLMDMFCSTKDNVILTTQSSTDLGQIPDNSIDYIFTDPPFGDNLNYSELSFIWEVWLKVKTNNKTEAVINPVQGKALLEYQGLMTKCFSEFYRILKPNRWMTVEFHNSKNAVWNAIQESLRNAGFIIADVRTLDKKRASLHQLVVSTAVQQDLAITAYKPQECFLQEFVQHAGTENSVWDFTTQYLENLPVVVKNDGLLEVISERQAFLLWDRMVAFHIVNGMTVPMDAADFYRGLDEKYLKRDNMYYLPAQVNEYDLARSTCEIQNIQFSFFVFDEKSAISWLYQELDPSKCGPQTYAELQPKFLQEAKAVDKREKMPELLVILEENFLKDDEGRWYIPDLTKSGDIAKLREKNLLKEFQEYLQSKGKLKVFRSEAIRAGFAKLWKDKDYAAIVSMAERLPEETIQEDPNLLMYYDISLSRV